MIYLFKLYKIKSASQKISQSLQHKIYRSQSLSVADNICMSKSHLRTLESIAVTFTHQLICIWTQGNLVLVCSTHQSQSSAIHSINLGYTIKSQAPKYQA